MERPGYVGALRSTLVPLAGCSTGTAAGTSGNTAATAADPSDPVASGPGSYPHSIDGGNEQTRAVTLTVEVEWNGTQLYGHSHIVPAETRRKVAGFTVDELPGEEHEVRVSGSTASGCRRGRPFLTGPERDGRRATARTGRIRSSLRSRRARCRPRLVRRRRGP